MISCFTVSLSIVLPLCAAMEAPLPAPEPLGPAGSAAGIVFHPHFDWEPMPGAEAYRVQVARDREFEHIVDDDTVHAVVQWYVTEKRLEPGPYLWRVRAETEAGAHGPWSSPVAFTVEAPRKIFHVPPDMPIDEIRRVGEEAAAAGSARIVLESADYFIDPGYERAVFEWEGTEDIIIDGNGARVHITDPSGQFVRLTRCRRVLVGGISFYHEPCPLAYGELLACDPDAGAVDIRVSAGFDGVNYPREVNQFFFYALDPANPRRLHPERPGHTYLTPGATQDLGGGKRRYVVREEAERPGLAQFEPGDKVLLAWRRWPQNWVTQCEDVTFFDLRGGCSEGSLFMGGGNKDMKFLRLVNPQPREFFPSTGAWVTGNDRRGPWVEGCRWEAMSDDGPNFTGNTYLVDRIIATDRLQLRTGVAWQNAVWRPGDALLFWDPVSGAPVAETAVVSAERCGPGESPVVRVSGALPDKLRPGNDVLRSTHVYNLSTHNRQLVLRGNTLIGGRRFGFFVKAIDALIEKNRFVGQSSSALFLEAEPSGWEGLVNRNIVVQDNYIEDCGGNEWSVRANRANIHVNTWRCDPIMAETPWVGNRDILVRRNTIVDREGIGIGVDNAANVTIRGNVITSRDKDAFLYEGEGANAAIRVFERTRNVDVEANQLTDTRQAGGGSVVLPPR